MRIASKCALVALLLVPSAMGCHRKEEAEEEKQPPVEVKCTPASRTTLAITVALRGRTATPPGGDLPVASQVPGKIIETKVKEGDRIAKGAVIATVDDLLPRAQAKQADATLARAKSADVQAQATLARTKALFAQGLASKADVDDATAKAEAARAEIEADQAGLRLAAGTLGRVEVRSTFEGVVTKVWRGLGAIVDGTAATPIVQIASTGAAEFLADATGKELALIADGQSAEIVLESGAELHGSVVATSRALDPATGLGSVRILLEPPKNGEPAPPLGSFGRVSIEAGKRDGVIVVPTKALRGAVADGAEIALCEGDKAKLRTIVVGYRDAEKVEVLKGLKEGESVATGHILGLEDGTKIAPGKGDDDDKDDHKEEKKKAKDGGDDDDKKKP